MLGNLQDYGRAEEYFRKKKRQREKLECGGGTHAPQYSWAQRRGIGSWTPATPSGLKGWWKETGIVGSPITDINDDSGNSYNLSQATSGFRPTVATYSSKSVAQFDGTDDFVSRSWPSGFIPSTAYGVYMVFQATGAPTGTGAGFYTNEGLIADANQYWGSFLRDGSGGIYQVGAYHWDTAARTSFVTLLLNTWYYWEATYDGTNVTCRLGTTSGTPVAAASVNASVGGSLYLGRGGTAKYSNAQIAETVVYNAPLAGGDLTSMRTYMASRWGVTT